MKDEIQELLSGRLTIVKVIYLYSKMLLTPCGREFAALKDKHKGQNAYVIGNGPSLTIPDLELIKDHGGITFAVNGIFFLFDKTAWRPDYYFFSDVNFDEERHKEYKKQFEKWVPRMSMVIYNRFYWHDTGINDHMIPYKTNIVKNVLRNSKSSFWRRKAYDCKFSRNARMFVYDGDTCIQSIIQLCYYMGFKKVYLLGTDCSFTGDKAHVYEENLSEEYKEDDRACFPNMIRDYIALYKDMKKKHIDMEVFNATRGGDLEVFPRVGLEETFAMGAS